MSGSGRRVSKFESNELIAEYRAKLDKLERSREWKPAEVMHKVNHLLKEIDLDTALTPFDGLNLMYRGWDIQYDILLDQYIRDQNPEDYDPPEIPPTLYLKGRDIFRHLKAIEKWNLAETDERKHEIHEMLDEADTHQSMQPPVYGFVYERGLELIDKLDEYAANKHIKRLGQEVAEEPVFPKEIPWIATNKVKRGVKSRMRVPDNLYHKLHNIGLMDVGNPNEADPYEGWSPTPSEAISRLQCKERPNEHTLMLVQDNKTFVPDMKAAKEIFEAKVYECLMDGLCKVSFQYVRPQEFLKGCPPLCWQGATSAADTPEEHFNLDNPSYTRIRGRLMRGEEIDPVWLDKTKPWDTQYSDSCPVWCHEGRHRAMTAMKEGIKLIPAIVVEPNDEARDVYFEQCNIIKKERRIKQAQGRTREAEF